MDKRNQGHDNPIETLGPVGHSGDLGYEKPVNEFDNTPLSSVTKGVLTAPDDLATLPENMPSLEAQTESTKETRKKPKALIAIGAVAAAAVAVVGGALAFTKSGHESKVQAITPTSVSGPAPVSSASTPETTPTDTCPPASGALYDHVAAELWPCMVPEVIAPSDKITATDSNEIIKAFFKEVEFSVNNEFDSLAHLRAVTNTDDPNNTYVSSAQSNWIPIIRQARATGHPIFNLRLEPNLDGLASVQCETVEGAVCTIPDIFTLKQTAANSEIITPQDPTHTHEEVGVSFVFHDGTWKLKSLSSPG